MGLISRVSSRTYRYTMNRLIRTSVRYVAEDVDKFIKSNKVAIISKQGCPFCSMAINSFHQIKQKPAVWDITLEPKQQEIQSYCHKLTGARSVPRVWINQQIIGGGSEVASL